MPKSSWDQRDGTTFLGLVALSYAAGSDRARHVRVRSWRPRQSALRPHLPLDLALPTGGTTRLADTRVTLRNGLVLPASGASRVRDNAANQPCEVRASAAFALLAVASYKLPEANLCNMLTTNV
jgi:hypothetical protein